MKLKTILALLLALCCMLPLVACSNKDESGSNASGTSGDPSMEKGEVKVKVIKGGRSLCAIIRTAEATVVIDTSDIDNAADLTEFLAEKGITQVDAVILTNYSKKCIGGMPDLLASGVTVKAVYGPTYTKDGNNYTLFDNAMKSKELTTTKVDKETTLEFGDISLTLYPALKDHSTPDSDEDNINSMAVALNYGETSMLFTSRVDGGRLNELIEQLDGKTFDLFTVPNFAIYDGNSSKFFDAVKATYAAVIASTTNPPEAATLDALEEAGVKSENTLITSNGSIEISSDGSTVTMKQ